MDSRPKITLVPLEQTLQSILDRRRAQSLLRNLSIASPDAVDFSSNDFLSLSTSKELRNAYLKELSSDANPAALGSGGSRLLDGNSAYAEALERQIAAFHSAPSGLLFNSGFDANSGFFACVPQKGDIVLYDAFIHASVHDGMKLSRASKCLPFQHNCISDLSRLLNELKDADELIRAGSRNVFIAVESIYSMDGDLAPLKEIVNLVETALPFKNGHIIVDEAHSTGVLGPCGRGLVCELGLEHHIFARLHTFGKALACTGAILLCSPVVRHYLINYARPLIYTTFLSFPALVAIRTSYTFLEQGRTEALQFRLRSLVTTLFDELQSLSARHNADGEVLPLISVPHETPRSAIFSILTPHPRSLAKYCQEANLMVRAVVPPTVPTRRIRVCLHAGNTTEQIERLVTRIDRWLSFNAEKPEIDAQPEKARL